MKYIDFHKKLVQLTFVNNGAILAAPHIYNQSFIFTMKIYQLYFATLVMLFGLVANAKPSADQGITLGMIHCCVEEDVFMWQFTENIRKEAQAQGAKVVFANARGDQQAQLKALDDMRHQNVDALLMSIVIDDTLEKPFQKTLIERLTNSQIPVVFYLLAVEDRFLQTAQQAYRVGSIPAQSGIMQGEMVSRLWLENPQWDTNGDGIMQYAILKGPIGNPDAEDRTKWVRATLDTFPVGDVRSQEVALEIANFDRKQGSEVVNRWVNDGTMAGIEVLIANNDDMLLGAHDVLSQTPYHPALFGIDALPEIIGLIEEGEVSGSILQDINAQSSHAYRLAANLAAKRPAEQGLDYPLVRQELIVPYVEITKAHADKAE